MSEPSIKRHAVFAGQDNFPSGGWDDCFGLFSTVEEATRKAVELRPDHDWVEVIDLADQRDITDSIPGLIPDDGSEEPDDDR